MPATLLQFSEVNDAAARTTKRLQKQRVLAEYFRGLDEADLRLAVRYTAGRDFPFTDERTLGVGGALVSDAVLELRPTDPHAYHDLVVRSGEIGEALEKMWGDPPAAAGPSLMLWQIAAAFDDIAATGNQQRKRTMLRELFAKCIYPREAAYLAKIIFGDLRTGVQEGVLQAAIAQAFDHPLSAIQRCQLLAGDIDEVAVLAQRKALDSASFKLFHPIQFTLATPQETADQASATIEGRSFFAEDKLDGIRAQVHKSGDRIELYTRTMDRTDESFPDVVRTLRELPGDFLLDGEIVPYRDGQVLPFAHIQRRLGRKKLTPAVLRDNPCQFIAFDILYRDGQLLMDQPLRVRREQLQSLSLTRRAGDGPTSPLLLTTATEEVSAAEQIERRFCLARDCRNEGLILKDPDSPYSPGRRGKAWLKLKTHLPTFDCVVTAAEFGHGKRRNSLSDYTFAVWSAEPTEDGVQLVNIGKAYSGVTDAEIAQLTQLFLKLSRAQYGRVHAVEPKVVLEIACDQIQKSARHASGYALRFPRIKRIRWDKRPEDADRLSRLIEVYESTANFGRSETPPEPTAEPTLFDGM